LATANQVAATLLAAALTVCAPAVCRAQAAQSPQPAPCVATQTTPCPPAPAAKSNDDKFPFPGETPDVPIAPVPGASASQTPAAPADAQKPPNPDKFPFPDDVSSSSSSSSSNTGANPDADPSAKPGLDDKGSEGTTTPGRHLLHRVNPPGTKLQTDDEREAEDLSIAKFYLQSGDLPGALLRSKDAVKTVPDDPDAHYMLAQTFQRLEMREQAVDEYNACLKLSPDDKEASNARKALAKLAKP
jgi:tetratricopeptide (TPR) repeat protein